MGNNSPRFTFNAGSTNGGNGASIDRNVAEERNRLTEKLDHLTRLRTQTIILLTILTTLFFSVMYVIAPYSGAPFNTQTNVIINIIRILVILPIWFIGDFIYGFIGPFVTVAQMSWGYTAGMILKFLGVVVSFGFASLIVWSIYVYIVFEVMIAETKKKLRNLANAGKQAIKRKALNLVKSN